LIGAAFLGYVLPWTQISFWACIVITNLISVVPYLGSYIILWVWGGFSVNNSTLGLFFTLHFLLPFIILLIVTTHLLFLHETGRTSSIFTHTDIDKIIFIPIFISKDLLNILPFLGFIFLCLELPFYLGDPEIFITADQIKSPIHIVPEIYFLFAYCILRSIPNKILGVFALLLSVLIFYTLILINNFITNLSKINIFLVFLFVLNRLILTWIGGCLVEPPFIVIGAISRMLYFIFVIILILVNILEITLFH